MSKYLTRTMSASSCRQRQVVFADVDSNHETMAGFSRVTLVVALSVFCVIAGYLFVVNATSVQGSQINKLESDIAALESEVRELDIAVAGLTVYSAISESIDENSYHLVVDPTYITSTDQVAFQTGL